jgi:hypothetical protein
MKQMLSLVFGIGFLLNAQAQGQEKFILAMKANIASLDTSMRNPEKLIVIANNFERIALAERSNWLPFYYAAFAQVNCAFSTADKSKTDGIADRAEYLITKADSLMPNNSEISCIKSMIASCRLMVNPMERFMKLGPISAAALDKAIEQDPGNPRPYLLKGQSLKFTPEQFGGGCAKALEQLSVAEEKFTTFKPASVLAPNWGKNYNTQLIEGCK